MRFAQFFLPLSLALSREGRGDVLFGRVVSFMSDLGDKPSVIYSS